MDLGIKILSLIVRVLLVCGLWRNLQYRRRKLSYAWFWFVSFPHFQREKGRAWDGRSNRYDIKSKKPYWFEEPEWHWPKYNLASSLMDGEKKKIDFFFKLLLYDFLTCVVLLLLYWLLLMLISQSAWSLSHTVICSTLKSTTCFLQLTSVNPSYSVKHQMLVWEVNPPLWDYDYDFYVQDFGVYRSLCCHHCSSDSWGTLDTGYFFATVKN